MEGWDLGRASLAFLVAGLLICMLNGFDPRNPINAHFYLVKTNLLNRAGGCRGGLVPPSKGAPDVFVVSILWYKPSMRIRSTRQPPAAVNARPHAPAHLQLETPKFSRPTRGDLRGVEKASLLQAAAHQLADKKRVQLRRECPVLHNSTRVMYTPTDNLRGASGRKPDGAGTASSGLVASFYHTIWTHSRGVGVPSLSQV